MVVPAHSLVAPRGAMGGQWSLAAYYRSILMCSVLCQFFLRERTRQGTFLNKPKVSTTSGSNVMAEIVVFMFSLTLTFDLCSIFLSHALRMMYWNIHAKFH